jgi:hypothetical protein
MIFCRAIEDNVRATCSDLVAECVVVGNGRPSPALFVEPTSGEIDYAKLKNDILWKTQEFHSRRYLHEQITNADMIIVVDRGTLPRTAVRFLDCLLGRASHSDCIFDTRRRVTSDAGQLKWHSRSN